MPGSRIAHGRRRFSFWPDLLVIPRWADSLKLPKGIWREISLLDPERENDGYQAQVKIRGGAIVPLGKVIQNTGENSLDPLPLLVCLDEGGNASGDLYEDAGDGFGYQKSQYANTRYVAHREGDSVWVKIEKRSGNQAVAERVVQVRVITDDEAWKAAGRKRKRSGSRKSKRQLRKIFRKTFLRPTSV